MVLMEKVLANLPVGRVVSVQVGLMWTMVVVETANGKQAGLAATMLKRQPEVDHKPVVHDPQSLAGRDTHELASLVYSSSATEVSIGVATINALSVHQPQDWIELNAEDYLLQHGRGRKVAVIGHFPFVESLKSQVEQLWVFELNPCGDDLPAVMEDEILPQADLVALTGMTMINGTFDHVISCCAPQAEKIVVGPSTLMHPAMFDYVDVLCGTIVEDIEKVGSLVGQGASIRQIYKAGGIRWVTIAKKVQVESGLVRDMA